MLHRKLLFKSGLISKAMGCYATRAIKPFRPKYIKSSSHKKRLDAYFKSNPRLQDIKDLIPSESLLLHRRHECDHLYLIDPDIATDIGKRIIPILKESKKHKICENCPGLGLLTLELLNGGIDLVRLYEPSAEYRSMLKGFDEAFPGKIELFYKDIFFMSRLSYIDKFDRGNRVDQLLKGIPKLQWEDEPCMTIIGAMPTIQFLKYLFKMITLQSEIINYGRTQIIAIMKPGDYLQLTAGPHLNLHTYVIRSVLFRTYFEIELLAKYPRKAFLPWQSQLVITSVTHLFRKYDLDNMYLVRINMKRLLPLPTDRLLAFHTFVEQFFLRGSKRVIPTVEAWIPGIGSEIITQFEGSTEMSIYIKSGQLTPDEILQLFKIVSNNPMYENSPFTAMVEAKFLKSETIETAIFDEEPTKVDEKFSETPQEIK